MKAVEKIQNGLVELNEQNVDFKSDMLFFKKDMTFLKHVLDRYFRKILKIENIDELRECVMCFQDLTFAHAKLMDELELHRSKLLYALDAGLKENKKILVGEHLHLSYKLQQFTSVYLKTRVEILSLTNETLDKEESRPNVNKRMGLFSHN